MSARIIILGSGKMARDVGLWFIGHGHHVTWVSADPGRREDLDAYVQKKFRRISRFADHVIIAPSVTPAEGLAHDAVDVVLESTVESLDAKQRACASVARVIGPETVLLTNSSSILPWRIDPRCVGMHFFYPVELTRFVEVVLPDDAPAALRERLTSFAESCELTCLMENERSAFSANRLLLPLQAEALRLVKSGWSAEEVNACSVSELLSTGVVGMMDHVGVDVMLPAVRAYVASMSPEDRRDYQVIIDSLQPLAGEGRRGEALLASNGLSRMGKQERAECARDLLFLLVNTCCEFVARGLLDEEGVDRVLGQVFQATATYREVIAREGADVITDRLQRKCEETACLYFRPSEAGTQRGRSGLGEAVSRSSPSVAGFSAAGAPRREEC